MDLDLEGKERNLIMIFFFQESVKSFFLFNGTKEFFFFFTNVNYV